MLTKKTKKKSFSNFLEYKKNCKNKKYEVKNEIKNDVI